MADTWHILGAGSMGCLFASHLSLAGHPVQLLLKDSLTLSQLQNSGLSLKEGSELWQPVISSSLIGETAPPINKLLITTKANQTLSAFKSIQHRIHPETSLVLLQNGMGIYEELCRYHPAENIFCAISTEGAYQTERFQLIHAGRGITQIGSRSDSRKNPAIEDLFNISLECQWCEDIYEQQWKKLAINCAINGLTAIHQCKNGELAKQPKLLKQVKELCEEISQACQSIGHGSWVNSIYEDTLSVINATANNQSSTLQDVLQGKATEIDALNGFFCREMKRLGIKCPHNQRIWESITAIEADFNQ